MKIPFLITFFYLVILSGCTNYSKPDPITTVTHKTSPAYKPNSKSQLLRFNITPDATKRAQVYVLDNDIIAQVEQQKEQRLAGIYPPLLRQAGNQYLRHGDYNQDGYNDIAILSTLDTGGSNPCYFIHYYQADIQRFERQVEATHCNLRG